MLKIEKLKKHFGGIKAVDGCSFRIKEGRLTALIGPNGSGKTTLFNLITGSLKSDDGKIFFNKNEISGMSVDKIARMGVSRLFQQSRIFNNMSIWDNIAVAVDSSDTSLWKNFLYLSRSNDQKKKVDEIVERLNLGKIIKLQGRNASFGQKRLTEIARALVMPHQLLLLDEPVAGINPRLREEIASLLINLKKEGETVVFIEHDMQFTLGIADYIVVMDQGRVIARGKPKEIKNNPKVLSAYLGQ